MGNGQECGVCRHYQCICPLGKDEIRFLRNELGRSEKLVVRAVNRLLHVEEELLISDGIVRELRHKLKKERK